MLLPSIEMPSQVRCPSQQNRDIRGTPGPTPRFTLSLQIIRLITPKYFKYLPLNHTVIHRPLSFNAYSKCVVLKSIFQSIRQSNLTKFRTSTKRWRQQLTGCGKRIFHTPIQPSIVRSRLLLVTEANKQFSMYEEFNTIFQRLALSQNLAIASQRYVERSCHRYKIILSL